MTRHEFLAALHRLLNPTTYLEIGVQTGASLALAAATTRAIAVDPDPRLSVPIRANTLLYARTSDKFFVDPDRLRHFGGKPVDLAFIDGMHLAEFALRDFIGVENLGHVQTVVAFDDVLPRNRTEASRMSNPGDWTGDVWKIAYVLWRYRPDLTLMLADVVPTGLLVVTGLDPASTALADQYEQIEAECVSGFEWMTAPDDVINRIGAMHPDDVLARIAEGIHV